MDKMTAMWGVIVSTLIILTLWQVGFFGSGQSVCDPVDGGFGLFAWNEMLFDTDGNFYVKVVNPRSSTITLTNISINSPTQPDIIYTVETPLPLQVDYKKEVLIAGRYESLENIGKGDEYQFHVDMTYTTVVAGSVVEHKTSEGMMGRYGIVEVPKPC